MDLSAGSVAQICGAILASGVRPAPPKLEVLRIKTIRSANEDDVVVLFLSDGTFWMPAILVPEQTVKVDQVKVGMIIVLDEFTLNHGTTREGKRGRVVSALKVRLVDGEGPGGEGVASVETAVDADALYRPVPRRPQMQVEWDDLDRRTGLHALSLCGTFETSSEMSYLRPHPTILAVCLGSTAAPDTAIVVVFVGGWALAVEQALRKGLEIDRAHMTLYGSAENMPVEELYTLLGTGEGDGGDGSGEGGDGSGEGDGGGGEGDGGAGGVHVAGSRHHDRGFLVRTQPPGINRVSCLPLTVTVAALDDGRQISITAQRGEHAPVLHPVVMSRDDADALSGVGEETRSGSGGGGRGGGGSTSDAHRSGGGTSSGRSASSNGSGNGSGGGGGGGAGRAGGGGRDRSGRSGSSNGSGNGSGGGGGGAGRPGGGGRDRSRDRLSELE
jgi:hypothetical protein